MIGPGIAADAGPIGALRPRAPTGFVNIDRDQALTARHDHSAPLDHVRAALL